MIRALMAWSEKGQAPTSITAARIDSGAVTRRRPLCPFPQVARHTHCAMVVMGAVSRSGLKSIFIGNTAERVLDRLQCDLLVVKPLGFETRVPRAVRGVRIAAAAPLP